MATREHAGESTVNPVQVVNGSAVLQCGTAERSKGRVTVTRQIEPTVSIQLLLALGVEEKYIFF